MAEYPCGDFCSINPYDHDPHGNRIYIDHSWHCWCGAHTQCANPRCRCVCHTLCIGCKKLVELSKEKPERRKEI